MINTSMVPAQKKRVLKNGTLLFYMTMIALLALTIGIAVGYTLGTEISGNGNVIAPAPELENDAESR